MNEKCEMKVRRLAGVVTIIGVTIGFFVSSYGYLLVVFAGLNLLQSSFTNICPPKKFISDCQKEDSEDNSE